MQVEVLPSYPSLSRRAADLVVLGLGRNGHIGFNEPGTPWDSRTRRVRLTQGTRRANARFFGRLALVPREVLSMGTGTILSARRILLLAAGAGKRTAVRRLLTGASAGRTLWKHVLPNMLSPTEVQISIAASDAVLIEAASATWASASGHRPPPWAP